MTFYIDYITLLLYKEIPKNKARAKRQKRKET